MSTSKKPSPKTSEPKAKYAIGNKVFFIDMNRSKTGIVLQAKIEDVRTIKYPHYADSGKIEGYGTKFEYDVVTRYGWYGEVDEYRLYPTLISASLVFTNNFVHLLK